MRCLLIGWLFAQQFIAGQQAQRPITREPASQYSGSVHLTVPAMEDDAIALAYPEKRRELAFASGRFSSNGDLFAVCISEIKTGSPEQVWLYDLRSRRLVALTEQPPEEPGAYVRIDDLLWADDGTLYISGSRIHGTAHPFFIAATATEVRRIESLPDRIGAERRVLDAEPYIRQERNDHYVVTLQNQGHGDIVLRAAPAHGGPTQQIARAGWELESFLFAGDRSEVLYPTSEAIIAFDVQTGKSRFLLRGTGGDLRLLDRTRDGKLIAYTVFGPCVGKPDYSSPIHQPRHVCFVQVE